MAALRILWMGLLFLGALGFLHTSAQDQDSVQPNFQQDKFLGRWFVAGLASNSSWYREKKKTLFMCRAEVIPSEGGGLNVTSTLLRKNQCKTETLLLEPAQKPGLYTYNSPHGGSAHIVSVVETNYDQYALLYSKGTKGLGQDFHMATLYSRTQNVGAELKDKFSTFCKARGFTEDEIVFLPQPDKCIQE